MPAALSARLVALVDLGFNLRAETGLHIGGGDKDIEIGGIDMPVIRNALDRRPYVPGSSLKGKMRSLLDRRYGLDANQSVGGSRIHLCKQAESLEACPVCPVFGVSAEGIAPHPTLVQVSDTPMSAASVAQLEARQTDAYLTEAKSEVAIDRVTSAANPRTQERVPAGAVFGPGRITLALYEVDGRHGERLDTLLEGLRLLELDYLGGGGSRGNGRVRLEDVTARLHLFPAGAAFVTEERGTFDDLTGLIAARESLLSGV